MASLNLANILDTSGNARHLTLGGIGVPTIATDPFGIGQNGLVLGSTNMMAAPGPAWALPAGDYTWDVRLKRTTANNGVLQVVFGRWGWKTTVSQYSYLLYFGADNKLNYLHETQVPPTILAPVALTSSAAITDGDAHAVRIVLSAGFLSMYIDGTRVAGPSAVSATATVDPSAEFLVGANGDKNGAAGGNSPLFATIGNLRLSNNARTTGASYTVETSPFATDANTVALIPMTGIAGSFISTPSYVGAALRRTGYSQASGGWANPDGPLPKQGGGYYFTASAWNGSAWSVWAVTAPTIADLISGAGTVGAAAIQTPVTGSEGNLAANGSVVWWVDKYYHYYQTNLGGTPGVRYSTGTDLGAPFSPQPGTQLFSGAQYFDLWVRPSKDGTHLRMYLAGFVSGTLRGCYLSTSTDGTTWTAPSLLIPDLRHPGHKGNAGEPSIIEQFDGNSTYAFSDGAEVEDGARRVHRWGTLDRENWFHLGKTFGPTGSDSGAVAYLSVFDESAYLDEAENRILFLAAHSTNTEPAQPTNSDIAVWSVPFFAPISFAGTVPAQTGAVGGAFSLALAGYFTGPLTPYTYSVLSGALPTGVTINASTGVLSGTLAAAGSFAAVIQATDSGGNTAQTGTISFTIAAASLVTEAFRDYSGALLAGVTIENVLVHKIIDRSLVASLANQVTHATTGVLTLGVSVAPGTACMITAFNADGTVRGAKRAVAA